MAFSGKQAHGNLYRSRFQLFFKCYALKMIQLSLLHASERSGQILGDTVEVYIYFVTP